MRDLHEQLRNLVSQHGARIAENAEQFRAALDDYLTEADASQGELNLLVDAVRLGGVERLLAMLDNGADPDAAVREAGGALARDRSSDEQRSRWAVAAMGYALGRVGDEIVRGQLGGEATRLPYGATAPAAPTPPGAEPRAEPAVPAPGAEPGSEPRVADSEPATVAARRTSRRTPRRRARAAPACSSGSSSRASRWRRWPSCSSSSRRGRTRATAATTTPPTEAVTRQRVSRAWRARATSTSSPTAGTRSPTRCSRTTRHRPPSTRRAPGATRSKRVGPT